MAEGKIFWIATWFDDTTWNVAEFLETAKLRLARAGLTQRDLAAALDCDEAQVSKWFNYRAIPSGENLVAMSYVLNLRPTLYIRPGSEIAEMRLQVIRSWSR